MASVNTNNSYFIVIENKDTFNIVSEIFKENSYEKIEGEEIIEAELSAEKNIGIVIENKNLYWLSFNKTRTVEVVVEKLKQQYPNIRNISLTQIPII